PLTWQSPPAVSGRPPHSCAALPRRCRPGLQPQTRRPPRPRRLLMIDSHCHLADQTFAGDLEQVVARAMDAGLERALVILEAGNEKEREQADRLTEIWPDVRVSIGVHPHQAHQFADDPERAAKVVRDQFAATPA